MTNEQIRNKLNQFFEVGRKPVIIICMFSQGVGQGITQKYSCGNELWNSTIPDLDCSTM